MRVIAGEYRSRLLAAPKGMETRPTSDRLRETLFNILAPRLSGARFADLYAGSGAVGIEALSRGAEHVFFAEKAPAAVGAIRANLASLKIAQGFTLVDRASASLIDKLANRAGDATGRAVPGLPLDLVFLDPPWEDAGEYTSILALLGSSRVAGILAPGAMVIAEHSAKSVLPERAGMLIQTRTLKQGDAALTFYVLREREQMAAEPAES